MNGCISFDPRRADPTKVQVFSCGGRGDGQGGTSNSQQFAYGGGNSLVLAPVNQDGKVCLVENDGTSPSHLDQVACSGGAEQVFTVVQ